MTTAFASSMLNSEKIMDANFQLSSSCHELTSLLMKRSGLSFEHETASDQNHDTLLFSSDTFISGHHFNLNDHPQDIARCMLRTSLSNMASCGTHIKGYLTALSLPQNMDPSWLPAFKSTLSDEQKYFQLCALGDDVSMTSGPLTLTFTFVGIRFIRPKTQAQMGDCLYMTGFLGDREMGHFLLKSSSKSKIFEDDIQYFRTKYFQPDPQIHLMQRLLPFVNTCLNLGEGLVTDLTHLCRHANLQAYVDLTSIPRSEAFQRIGKLLNLDLTKYGLFKSGDRELLFSAPLGEKDQIAYLSHAFDLSITPIGYMGIRQDSYSPQDTSYISWIGDHGNYDDRQLA